MAIKRQAADAIRPTRIWAEARATLNVGPYETLEIKVGEEAEVVGDRDEAARQLGQAVRTMLETECREAVSDLPVEAKGMQPSGRLAIHFSKEL